jgi:hypothetical protein
MRLHVLDIAGNETEDTTFQPIARAYQSHPVAGTGRPGDARRTF